MPCPRRTLIASVAALWLALGLGAGPATAEPAIWRISDADSDIYIFGTVHILPPSVVWRTPAVQSAFDSADTIWFEAPANDPSAQLDMFRLIQQLGLNPPASPLSTQISADARMALEEIAARVGLSAAALEPFRPWFAAVTLTAAYVESQGYNAASGVEAQLWPLAEERGKRLDYFETLEEQLRFFADLPQDIEVEMFEQTVLEYRDTSDQLDSLVAAWEAGRIAEIDELVNGELRRTAPEVYEVVILERNASWVEEIRTLLAGSGSHFIAIGAGHVAGNEGVIERLRAAGIEVDGP